VSTLVVMGSGETTPTMVTTHQRVLAAVPADRTRLVLDTPYGFQENADELTARTCTYLAHHVGSEVEVASLRRASDLTPVGQEALLARVREAGWVYAGPGSPTYLARQWRATGLPEVLRERLADTAGDHALVFASAAAATLGAQAIPVYEIYKAGEEPRWEPGLDLLRGIGLDAVLVAHFDNQEGGTHDTRYCYLGARRLALMEGLLPPETWVLGVDEHTALVADLGSGEVRVEGRGGVTVRAGGHEVLVVPAGATTTLEALVAAAQGTPGGPPGGDLDGAPHGASRGAGGGDPGGAAGGLGTPATPDREPGDAEDAGRAASPLLTEVGAAAAAFDAALAADDPLAAAEVTVGLEATIQAWSTDVLQSDEMERARGELRRQVVGLARLASAGLHEHRDLVSPLVELLLELRRGAREDRRFTDADRIRDALLAAAVEVRDSPTGTDWVYDDPLDGPRG
jgi:hypothetical protein